MFLRPLPSGTKNIVNNISRGGTYLGGTLLFIVIELLMNGFIGLLLGALGASIRVMKRAKDRSAAAISPLAMHFTTILCISLLPLAASLHSTAPQHVFSNPPSSPGSSFHIPTIHESAIQARRILHLSSIATLSTVFPSPPALGYHLVDLAGVPIGLMDYYASCSPYPFHPTILAIDIATSFRNTAAGSNMTLSLRYHPPEDRPPSDDIYTYSPANMPRFSLVGHVEAISETEVKKYNVDGCFLEHHPDAEAWLPGNRIHESWWARLVVDEVYWIGGFGDRAYIGWIPVEEWESVTEEEVEKCRLVGEKLLAAEEQSHKVGL